MAADEADDNLHSFQIVCSEKERESLKESLGSSRRTRYRLAEKSGRLIVSMNRRGGSRASASRSTCSSRRIKILPVARSAAAAAAAASGWPFAESGNKCSALASCRLMHYTLSAVFRYRYRYLYRSRLSPVSLDDERLRNGSWLSDSRSAKDTPAAV